MTPVAITQTSNRIPLGEYIFRRIESLGVSSVFGVPGDFNLAFLEHIYSTSVQWYSGCNELNVGYSADGYARASGKFGVMVTTYGVGALSAMNANGGSWAEFVPVLHIVGSPAVDAKSSGASIHHSAPPKSLDQPTNHFIYEEMVKNIACKVETLDSLKDSTSKIDFLIKEIIDTKRPGFLVLPCNLVDQLVDATPLEELPSETFYGSADDIYDDVAKSILVKLSLSTSPCILGDILTDRFGQTAELRSFVERTRIPSLSTFMGKSILDESSSTYVGDYNGDESSEDVQKFVCSCDLVLHIGDFYNEINSGHGTLYKGLNQENLIQLNHERIQVGTTTYKVSFVHILPRLNKLLAVSMLPETKIPDIPHEIVDVASDVPISQTLLLKELQSFLRPNDTIVVDTGSIMFGLADLRLPKGCRIIGQHFYLSIGMALPASFGVSVALREKNLDSRLILLEGDGAAQMTIQELATFNRYKLSPLILLLNNEGYTVERAILGPTRPYNDIMPNWKWTQLLDVFGHENSKSASAEQPEQLRSLLQEFADGETARLLEIKLGKLDVPWRFEHMCH